MTPSARQLFGGHAPVIRALRWSLPALIALAGPAFAVNSSVWSTVQPILQRNVAVLSAPPLYTPGANLNLASCNSVVCGLNVPDGPVLGNGGVTAAIGGTAAAQTWTLTTTDFWLGFVPKVVGSVTVNTPGFDAGATYNLAQDPGLAEARAIFTEGAQQLKIRSIVFSTANLLLIQLSNPGTTAIAGVQIVTHAGSVGTQDALPTASGVQSNAGYVTRSTAVSGNPYPATDALATFVVDGTSTTAVKDTATVQTTLNLAAGATVNVVVGVGGGAGSTTYLNDAVTLATAQTDASLTSLITAHEAWWQNFWSSGATVDLGGGPVERLWYSWLYMLAAGDRAGHIMPGMQIIQTEDYNLWDGWWTSDYNIENTYLGVYSANHPELAAPYNAALNQYLPTAESNVNVNVSASYPEVYTYAQWGPGSGNQYLNSWGCNGDSVWLATDLVYQWNYTRNATWASQVAYPWMLAAAHWYDQRLVYQNGYYNVVGSSQNEASQYTLNPIGDLANLRGLYTALIDMNQSGAVTSSASDLALWQTELANLAPLPTFTYNGHTDFKATQDAPGFYAGDAMPANPAIWAPVVGLGSSAATLQAMQNTIYDLGDNATIWYQFNSIGWIYPAAARVGLPDVFSRLTATATGRLGEPGLQQANGTMVLQAGGGGGEGAGNIEAIDEMLLSSYDGVLRFFPAWPLARNASFSNMAAVGNFQVSSGITGGIIQATTVVSSSGRPLTIAQPWPEATISITDSATGAVVSGSTATVSTPTTAGHTYSVVFSGGTPLPVNLAQLATASASSDIGGIDWWAGYANDGQTASMPSTYGWSSSADLTGDHPEWYQLDLGAPMTFNKVTLWPRSDTGNLGQGFPSSYNIAVSNDNVNWTVVSSGTSTSPPTAAVSVPFTTETARYVRVNGLHLAANPNDANQYRMQLAEVGIFNSGATTAVPAFTLTLAAPSMTLAPGNGNAVVLTAAPTNGFTGTVNFSQSGLPAGVNSAFVSTGSANSDYFVIYVPPGTAGGTFPITLIGTSGTATASIAFTLVIPQLQTISFPVIPAQTAGTTLTLAAAASSGLPVSYSVSTPSVCSVSASTVSLLAAGTCTIAAGQAGSATWLAAASVSQSFTVNAAATGSGGTTAASTSGVPAPSTICQAQAGGSYCSDGTPGPVDANGYHNLSWVNLNKNLASIAVSDNQVWGLDSAQILWYLPNFKTGTTWTKVSSGVTQISAGHNLLCQINANTHVYCSASPNPLLSTPDANGFQSVTWVDTGATNFSQISVSAGNQFWGVDTSGNLIQVLDYTSVATTSTKVAAGVKQVAVDGRGTICQVNSNLSVYCSNWSKPAATASPAPYYGLPWVQTTAQLQNITMADGKVFGVDSSGKEWELPDYTNSATWFPVAFGGVGTHLAASSAPSTFVPADFASDEVAVLMFMGQSNAVGYNTQPARFVSPASPNVWSIKNAGWNFLAGNDNGTTPFTGAISSIASVQWTPWSISATGTDMNLGFNNNAGAGGNAANFAAYQWQGLVNAGWKLPDLYIIHIGWPSQGVDALDTTTATAAWLTHGENLWQPGLTSAQQPSYALAPFARMVAWRGMQSILAAGKKPRVLGLQWNQWEAEAGNANTAVLTDAPTNYKNLVSGFNSTLGTAFPIEFVKPLSQAYSASTLSTMQSVFANLAATDTTHLSVIDVSQASSTIFSGGVLGGGDGAIHYNLDTHQWFANQAISPCLRFGSCGTRITTLPAATPN